jgi:hypothetical protein
MSELKRDELLKGFETLLQLNVNAKTEIKGTGNNALKYLSWSEAWTEFVKVYPGAIYEILKNENNLPYFEDKTGAMVYVRVTANGLTHEMWLPVMDGTNKAMKKEPYTYQVKEYSYDPNQRKNIPTGSMIDKTVEAYTMFDINKTVMRCLTKCLAMFGLGLYIYNKEDMPEVIPEPVKTITKEMESQLEELIIKAAADRNRFLIAFEIKRLEDMPMHNFAVAIKSLKEKIEKNKGASK